MPSRPRLIPEYAVTQRTIPPALIDHAEVVIGDWALIGQVSDVQRVLESLPAITAETRDGTEVPVFTQARLGPRATSVEAFVSTGLHGTYRTRPVFCGKLATAWGRDRLPISLMGEHIRVGLEAGLNINHFIVAQSIPTRSRLDRPIVLHKIALALSHRFARHGNEYCLTDDTNLLIGPDAIFRYADSKPAEDHLLDAVDACSQFVGGGLAENAAAYGVRCQPVPYHSLRKIEFYWEFSHPNPIQLVESLIVPMRSLGDETLMHRALVRGEEVAVRQNSMFISCELSAGCKLIVYAKTNMRLRFEVRLDDETISRMSGGNRTTRDRGELRRMVQTLRIAATARFTQAMQDLDAFQIRQASQQAATQLCAQIDRLISDDDVAQVIVEALRMRGSVVATLDSPIRQAIETLCDANILQHRRTRKPVFIPTDPFIRAVMGLREGSL